MADPQRDKTDRTQDRADGPAPEKGTTEARQAESQPAPRRALRWGLALAIVLLVAIFVYFAAGR